MATKKSLIIGFIMLVITLTLVSVQLTDKVKIDIGKANSKFYVNESGSFVLSGTETSKIYGYTLKNIILNTTVNNGIVTIKRSSDKIIDTYTFDSARQDVESFPLSHKIEIINSSGKVYIYKVSNIQFLPTSVVKDNSISFGHKMKLAWDKTPDKITVSKPTVLSPYIELRYNIKSNYETFDIRLFDPDSTILLLLSEFNRSVNAEFKSDINISYNGTDTICLDINHPEYGNNISCSSSFTYYVFNPTYFNLNTFGEGSIVNISTTKSIWYTINNRTNVSRVSFNLSTITYTTTNCYQEFTNVSTSCGGLSTGNYTYGSPTDFSSITNISDGDWNTYTTATASGLANIFYKLPSAPLVDVIWQVKYNTTIRNITIPDICRVRTDGYIKLGILLLSNRALFACYTDSSGPTQYDTGTGTGNGNFFEEAIFWNFGNNQTTSTNISVNYGNTTKQFIGTLSGNSLTTNIFTYSGINYTTTDLIYTTPSSKTISFNMPENEKTLSFQLWGNDLDSGNNLSFTDDLYNSSLSKIDSDATKTYNVSTLTWSYDDFDTAKSTMYASGSGTYTNNLTGGSYEGTGYSSTTGAAPGDYSSLDKFAVIGNNLERFKTIYFEYSSHATTSAGAGSTAPYGTEGGGSITGGMTLSTTSTMSDYISIPDTYLRRTSYGDVTCYSSVMCRQYGDSDSATCGDSGNILLVRNEEYGSNTYTYTTYKNGVNVGTTTALSAGINLGSYFTISSHVSDSGCAGSVSATATLTYSKLSQINLSGISTQYLGSNSYRNNGTIESSVIYTTPNNISVATLTTVESEPSGCAISYWLSNDNGTTYETAFSGVRHTFASRGKDLRWKSNIYCSSNTSSAAITQAKLEITPGSITNISIDLLGDGTYEYTYNNTLNTTNSPQNVSFTYAQLGNDTGTYSVDIYAHTWGVMTLNNSNLISNINPIVLDEDELQNCNNCSILVNKTGAVLLVSDLDVRYTGGNKTYTITAHNSDWSKNLSHNVTYYYSDYSWAMPPKIQYVDFYPRTVISKNVTPYAQSNSMPIYNFTSNNFDSLPYNLSWYLNDTNSCVNLTVSFTNSKANGTLLLNQTWQTLVTNKVDLSSYGLWMWADLSCTSATWKVWNPMWYFRGCCKDCDICSTRAE